jgi:hypothetical protein
VPVSKYQASGPECRWTVVFMPGEDRLHISGGVFPVVLYW